MKRRTLVFGAPAAVVGAGMLAGITPFARAAGNVIRFGQSASLSGGQARYGRDVRDGIAAAFAAASKADPHGTRYELVTLDDGGISERCAQNVSTLIDGGCSALIGLTSGPGAEAAMPAVTASQIALLGIASGSMALRKPRPEPAVPRARRLRRRVQAHGQLRARLRHAPHRPGAPGRRRAAQPRGHDAGAQGLVDGAGRRDRRSTATPPRSTT